METVKLQSQIRQNAEELSSYLTDIAKWESSMNKKTTVKDSKASSVRGSLNNPIREAGTIKVQNNSDTDNSRILKSADSHTYDKGYKKWENFDVKDALDELDLEETSSSKPLTKSSLNISDATEEITSNNSVDDNKTIFNLTPANIISPDIIKISSTNEQIPKARGVESSADPEATERERGNQEFKTGNYTAAIKCYTKCLGMKPKNYTAFSNRAMAYLKTKEYSRAEVSYFNISLLLICTELVNMHKIFIRLIVIAPCQLNRHIQNHYSEELQLEMHLESIVVHYPI